MMQHAMGLLGRGAAAGRSAARCTGSGCSARTSRVRCQWTVTPGRDPPDLFGSSITAKRKATAALGAAEAAAAPATKWSYVAFAKAFPFANNMIIATAKTSAADLVAQCVIEGKSPKDIDWKRNLVFCMFGAVYLGAFQYFYQISVFKRIFTGMERFTSQPWAAKLKDGPGLMALGAQTVMDLGMLTFVYLPTFYVFKAFVFSSAWSVTEWVKDGVGSYCKNWSKDVYDVFRVWGPADLVCFSVPLWLRLPVRHVVSFVWTAYLSFVRGAKH